MRSPELANQSRINPKIGRRMSLRFGVRNYKGLPASAVGFGSPESNTYLRKLHCASQSDCYAGDWYSAKRQH